MSLNSFICHFISSITHDSFMTITAKKYQICSLITWRWLENYCQKEIDSYNNNKKELSNKMGGERRIGEMDKKKSKQIIVIDGINDWLHETSCKFVTREKEISWNFNYEKLQNGETRWKRLFLLRFIDFPIIMHI